MSTISADEHPGEIRAGDVVFFQKPGDDPFAENLSNRALRLTFPPLLLSVPHPVGCLSRASGNPPLLPNTTWTPAFAGVTAKFRGSDG
jgi:hypothetical protein